MHHEAGEILVLSHGLFLSFLLSQKIIDCFVALASLRAPRNDERLSLTHPLNPPPQGRGRN
ncbi:hypothetical protein [Helicobacter sp. 23-1045]